MAYEDRKDGFSAGQPPRAAFIVRTVDLDALKDDGADLPEYPMVIKCHGAGGVVRMIYMKEDTETTRDVPIAYGETLNDRPRRIHATGTTATGLIGGFTQ